MKRSEATWFRRCTEEIQVNDGHQIGERFLRLYQCGFFASPKNSEKESKSVRIRGNIQ
ncbi:hypothetical protein BH18THE2_BH18THE2_20990 [soil metagenome]